MHAFPLTVHSFTPRKKETFSAFGGKGQTPQGIRARFDVAGSLQWLCTGFLPAAPSSLCRAAEIQGYNGI